MSLGNNKDIKTYDCSYRGLSNYANNLVTRTSNYASGQMGMIAQFADIVLCLKVSLSSPGTILLCALRFLLPVALSFFDV